MLERVQAMRAEALLWVGINSDAAVRTIKGPERPVHDFLSRAIVIAGLQCVDRVFEIDAVRVDEAIRLVRPLCWSKGGDYTLETLDKDEVSAAREVGTDIILVPTIGSYSTSAILKRLQSGM
jgi:bifunctional ADP-heptose synthase (sugar kinase/adenylyltransferase)